MVRTDLRCPPDTVAWHGLMAIWMAAMLAVPPVAGADGAGLVVFGLGAAWAGLRLGLGAARTSPLLGPSGGAYLRTTVCCGAMVVMLLPGGTMLPVVMAVFVALLSGIVVGQGIRLLRGRDPGRVRGPGAARLAVAFELGTAAAMATMLGLAL